jgi:glutamyl/glutaminyl-tRNA synthetase
LVATRTRFAPAPTGFLHLGHVANALVVWSVARRAGATILLRIEDHDRQRSRPEYDDALLEDLAWLGFHEDDGPVRQSDADAQAAYAGTFARLRAAGAAYGCDCTRSTAATWAARHGRPWHGPGCPGACRGRDLDGPVWRIALGDGVESWVDGERGPSSGEVARSGDLPIRDRHGNWTYGLCVVVDDLRQDIDLVVRGEDLLEATPDQVRLGRLLGRDAPPTFLHHGLIRRPDGTKLSKSTGDTGVRELRAAGHSPAEVVGAAASALGLVPAGAVVPAEEAVAMLARRSI